MSTPVHGTRWQRTGGVPGLDESDLKWTVAAITRLYADDIVPGEFIVVFWHFRAGDGATYFGQTGSALTADEGNALRLWGESALGYRLNAGDSLDSDDLIGRPVGIQVEREPFWLPEDGEPNYVYDVRPLDGVRGY